MTHTHSPLRAMAYSALLALPMLTADLAAAQQDDVQPVIIDRVGGWSIALLPDHTCQMAASDASQGALGIAYTTQAEYRILRRDDGEPKLKGALKEAELLLSVGTAAGEFHGVVGDGMLIVRLPGTQLADAIRASSGEQGFITIGPLEPAPSAAIGAIADAGSSLFFLRMDQNFHSAFQKLSNCISERLRRVP